MTWTSRKRVETALDHREPDRVPTDLTITEGPYKKLRAALGLHPDHDLKASSFTEVLPATDVLTALGIDITWVKLRPPSNWSPPPPLADGSRLDEWGVGRKKIEIAQGIYLNEVTASPLKHATLESLENYPWHNANDPSRVEGLEKEARTLFEETNLAIMGRFGGTILEQAAYLRGWEQWLMDMIVNVEFARSLLHIIAGIQIKLDEVGIREAGKYLSIFKLSGEDFGMQDRPLFSRKLWEELVLPILSSRWKAAREALDRYAPHVKLLLHSDGAIRPFIKDIIASGVDILDPIQPRCAGMDLYALKRDFGDRLSFHGAVDTQTILPFGNKEQVEEEVVRAIDALGKSGGLILAPVHNVQADVPPENLITVYKAIQDHGQYPLPDHDPLPLVHLDQYR